LGTELHLVVRLDLPSSTFVLDGKRTPPTCKAGEARAALGAFRKPVELHDIRDASEAETERSEAETSGDAHVAPNFNLVRLGLSVELGTFDREPVLCPLTLQVNEGPLALAVRKVLQRRDRQQVSLLVH
jgi:hypothetical protein